MTPCLSANHTRAPETMVRQEYNSCSMRLTCIKGTYSRTLRRRKHSYGLTRKSSSILFCSYIHCSSSYNWYNMQAHKRMHYADDGHCLTVLGMRLSLYSGRGDIQTNGRACVYSQTWRCWHSIDMQGWLRHALMSNTCRSLKRYECINTNIRCRGWMHKQQSNLTKDTTQRSSAPSIYVMPASTLVDRRWHKS